MFRPASKCSEAVPRRVPLPPLGASSGQNLRLRAPRGYVGTVEDEEQETVTDCGPRTEGERNADKIHLGLPGANNSKMVRQHGNPCQRGYLLYGPPGIGKSSFSFSIAGRFDLDIYVLNISSLSDSKSKTLFSELPQHCVVLFEDVDAASSKRTKDTDTNLDTNALLVLKPLLTQRYPYRPYSMFSIELHHQKAEC